MTTRPVDPDQQPPAPPTRPPGGIESWLFGAWVGAFIAIVIVFAYVAGRDEGRDQAANAAPAQQAATPAAKKPAAAAVPAGPGQKLFVTTCGGCHTLGSAGTKGMTGPNLDVIKPDAARVAHAISNGGATGSGAMPKGLLSGKDATDVAAFVAEVAGR